MGPSTTDPPGRSPDNTRLRGRGPVSFARIPAHLLRCLRLRSRSSSLRRVRRQPCILGKRTDESASRSGRCSAFCGQADDAFECRLPSIQQVATATASSDLPANSDSTTPDQITASVDTSQSSVTVSITRSVASLFANIFTSASTISVTSTAQFKSAPICVLTLAGGGEAYNSKAASNLTANGCTIISNSTASDGVAANTSGAVTSIKTCSAGGYSGGSFNPTPITDCPPVADPLAVRSPPPNLSAACDHVNFAVSDTAIPLAPEFIAAVSPLSMGRPFFLPATTFCAAEA